MNINWGQIKDFLGGAAGAAGNAAIDYAQNSALGNQVKESAFKKHMKKYWPFYATGGFIFIVGLFQLFTRKRY